VSTAEQQQFAQAYRARRSPALVDVPELAFLMIDGYGDPNASGTYQAALQALFSVSYALKFAVKRAGGPAYRDVLPLALGLVLLAWRTRAPAEAVE